MSVLLLRLAGPMQSWGTQSRFTVRDTGLEPSRSGVIGLLCAALGRPRSEPLDDDFLSLKMAVRVDREGELHRDFHTAGGGRLAMRPLTVGGRDYGVVKASGAKGDTVVSSRDYLADADFLVAIAGERSLLSELNTALASPKWPLFLGRKSFAPGVPVQVRDDCLDEHGLLEEEEPESVLRRFPWIASRRWIEQRDRFDRGEESRPPEPQHLRIVVETDDPTNADGHPHDVPLSFQPRRFTTRHTRTEWIEAEDLRRIAISE